MYLLRLLLCSLFLFGHVPAQDSPNDDSDDDLPSCAASCQAALGTLSDACGNTGAISQFKSCVRGSQCSDDDQEGSGDWITSTCRVISRSMARTSTMASQTSASASATTTPASTSATTTASSSISSGTTTFSSISSLSSSSASSSSSSSSSSATSTTATATATATPTSSPTNTGLSTGAKAGIGVGVALGVLALLAALIFFCARRMRQSRRESKAQWPKSIFGFEGGAAKAGSYTDGSERGFGGAGAGRFEPKDPYSAPRPHPAAPELLGTERSELLGQQVEPAGGSAQMTEAPRGTPMFELPVEGAAIAGPLPTPYRIPRKQPTAANVMVEKPVSSSSGSALDSGNTLSPSTAGDRPVSTISDLHVPAGVPLPLSPVSPTSPTLARDIRGL